MPSVSRNQHKVKDIVCDLAKDLLTAKVGDKIEIKLKVGDIVEIDYEIKGDNKNG